MSDSAKDSPKNPKKEEPGSASHKKEELLTLDKLAMKKGSKLPIFRVNLLMRKEEQLKVQARLLKWLLSSGRFIVVFVELLTIGAFVYRYKLDTDLADLQDKIKEQVLYIQSLKNDEAQIRQTQFQLATIKQARNDGTNYSSVLVKIAGLTPKNIKLLNITINTTPASSQTTFAVTGETPSNLELSAFIRALQKDPAFAGATLTNVSFEGTTSFTITGTIATKGVKSS